MADDMDDIHKLNQDIHVKIPAESETESNEAERTHRRVEDEASKLAERGKEREKNEQDRGEFSNIGPV